jgi:hypothetical protein
MEDDFNPQVARYAVEKYHFLEQPEFQRLLGLATSRFRAQFERRPNLSCKQYDALAVQSVEEAFVWLMRHPMG